MSNGTNDKCFVCSKSGHFAKDCKEKDSYDVWCCEKCNQEFTNKKECEKGLRCKIHDETWFTNKKECEKHEKGLRRKSPGGPGTPGETWF